MVKCKNKQKTHLYKKRTNNPFIQKNTRNLILFSPGTAEVLKFLRGVQVGTSRNRSSFDEIGFASNSAKSWGGDAQKARDQNFVQKISCGFPTKKLWM